MKSSKSENINDEKLNKCSFKRRVEAFEYLQGLALDIRQDNSIIFGEENPHEYLKLIHESQNNQYKKSKPTCDASKSVKANKVSSFRYENSPNESEITIASMETNESKKLSNLVSDETIRGLDSILQTLGDFDKKARPSKSTKVLRKKKSLKRGKASKCKATPLKRGNKINIPTHRLVGIVDSLNLII